MIRLNDIVVKFDNFTALHGINVHVKEGEFFTFLGPSGCGKTTTLRTITGFIEPAEGTVVVKEQDITHVPIEDRNIGIVFQSYALFPTMTVYDNIAFGLKVKKAKRAEIDQRVRDIARKVDLSDEQLQKAVSQLSGGQQQRVAIARALVTNPAIICMDEPLSNLDAKLRVQLRNELKKMQKDFGITTIYVTHDQEEALTLSDRIAVFNKGVIEQIGTPNEVYNHSATEFVCNFIGDINRLETPLVQYLNDRAGLRQAQLYPPGAAPRQRAAPRRRAGAGWRGGEPRVLRPVYQVLYQCRGPDPEGHREERRRQHLRAGSEGVCGHQSLPRHGLRGQRGGGT